jgi:transcriptional regulator with PAS, ATPase and Fis domain
MIGRSRALVDVARKVITYREKKQNVLILGDTGTGKELVARALHHPDGREFFAINCAAYKGNTELLEAELFGYEKGAFTGANQDKKGVLETAHGGTVFFDEIHQLALTAQAKLLRVFQERRIRRVGGAREYPVDFRLVAAAKPGFEERCESGEFLLDLYHRLAVLTIEIPPLRERVEDIEPLINHFCAKHSESTGNKRAFLLRTVDILQRYSWPGNVRELEHTVYRLLTDSPTEKISPEQLDAKFFDSRAGSAAPLTLTQLRGEHERQEIEHIQRALRESKNKFQAAKRLGVSPSTLHSIMKRAGLYQSMENEEA